MYVRIYVYVCIMYVCMHVCRCVYKFICMYVCMYVCIMYDQYMCVCCGINTKIKLTERFMALHKL